LFHSCSIFDDGPFSYVPLSKENFNVSWQEKSLTVKGEIPQNMNLRFLYGGGESTFRD
jgi:hypothetical protein